MLANLSQSTNINFEGYKTVFSKKFVKFLESKTSEITEKEALRDSFTKIVETKMNDKYKLVEGNVCEAPVVEEAVAEHAKKMYKCKKEVADKESVVKKEKAKKKETKKAVAEKKKAEKIAKKKTAAK